MIRPTHMQAYLDFAETQSQKLKELEFCQRSNLLYGFLIAQKLLCDGEVIGEPILFDIYLINRAK